MDKKTLWEKLNTKIEIPKDIKCLLIAWLGSWAASYVLFDIIDYFPVDIYRICVLVFPVLSAVPALVVFVMQKNKFKDLFAGNILTEIVKAVILGIVLFGAVTLSNGELQFGSALGLYEKYLWYRIYSTIYYICIVGFCEEFIYRVVIQGCFEKVLGKCRVIAPVLSAVAFSFVHWIDGDLQITLISFFFGLIWGYLRYFNKMNYFGISLSHGLYDYILLVAPLIL